jgi:hypothetical protein
MYKLIYLARRNPNASRAEWPDLWRSHSAFAGKFPGLRGGIKYSRYCNRVDAPKVGGSAVNLPGITTAHDGVAIAFNDTVEVLQGGVFNTNQRALIDCDELRVFDRLTPDFSFYCTETMVREGNMGEACVFRFLFRKPELSRVAFKERMVGEHARVARETIGPHGKVVRYALNAPLHRSPHPLFPYEAISECWYATAEDAARSLSENQLASIERDLKEFSDMDRSVTILTEVCNKTGTGG